MCSVAWKLAKHKYFFKHKYDILFSIENIFGPFIHIYDDMVAAYFGYDLSRTAYS